MIGIAPSFIRLEMLFLAFSERLLTPKSEWLNKTCAAIKSNLLNSF